MTKLTIMDAFNKTSTFSHEPEIGFGTGSRPPLMIPTSTPGPGAYQIKTTINKTIESTIKSPEQYTIRSRHKFGDPNLKSMSKTTANEPGPGQYQLGGRFLTGDDSEKYSFPKALLPPDTKSSLAPGPGSYALVGAMGKQVLSNKPRALEIPFPASKRPSLVPVGGTDIGPGEYLPPKAACEEQVDSRKPSCPNTRFGTGFVKGKNGSGGGAGGKSMKLDLSEPSPGPGSYHLPGGIATKGSGQPYRSSPQASISGRNAFGSPW